MTAKTIDYITKDYLGFREEMLRLATSILPEWTDRSESDMGVVIVELLAYMLDIMSYYQDRMINEIYLPTATQRKTVIALTKLLDYELKSAVPSNVELTFSVDPQVEDWIIPEGTQVGTKVTVPNEEQIIFETDSDLTILAGASIGIVTATQGESISEQIGISNGSENQYFQTSNFPYLDGTLKVFVDEGFGDVEWTFKDSLIDSSGIDKHYTIQTDENDIVTVIFGNGTFGRIPYNESKISVSYRIGGGKVGNVGINKIVEMITYIPNVIEVSNLTIASGGDDKESVESAKVLAPQSLRSLERVVNIEDFSASIDDISGVGKSSVEVVNWKTVNIYLAPEGGGNPSQSLKNIVLDVLNQRLMLTVTAEILNPTYVEVNGNISVYTKPNYNLDTVESDVQTALDTFFTLESRNFGEEIYLANIYSLIGNISGVRNVDIINFTSNPVVVGKIISGNATFSDIEVGVSSVRETWTIIMLTNTTFKVEGSVSGLQTTTGTLGTEFTSDNYSGTFRVKFTITAGNLAMQPNDYWEFITHKYIDNINLQKNEIAVRGTITISIY